MKQTTSRRCSVCRAPGHTKKTCIKKQVPAVRKTQKRTTKQHPSVVVRVGSGYTSPHVVRLHDGERQKDQRVEIPVHVDTTAPAPKRIAIDLGELVRGANAKREIRVINELPTVEKKHESTSTPQAVAHQKEKQAWSLRSLFGKQSASLPSLSLPVPSAKQAPLTKRSVSLRSTSVVTSLRQWPSDVRRSFVMFAEEVGNVCKRRLVGRRFAYSVLLLLVVITLPFPALSYYQQVSLDSARVVEESTNAFLSLQSSTIAALQSNLGQAKSDLNQALQSFATAEGIVERDHKMLAYVAGMLPVVGKQVSSRQYLLRAGQHLTLGNTYLVKGIDTVSTDESAHFTDRLRVLQAHVRSASVQYEAALADLAAIDVRVLPSEYQASFDEFKLLYAVFIDDMKDLYDLTDVMGTIFGSDDFRRYVVLFQNHHEIRPTGGFMGSFAVVDVQKGKILNIDVPAGGTYDIKGQVDVYLKPPLPLQLSNKRWEFQDANWFPDFAASAEKAAWFYERGRQTTVDGVIAVNATVLERLLRVLGPVENDAYDLVLDADTALTSIQQEVEFGQDKQQNKPKAVIAELLSQFLTGVTEVDNTDMIRLLGELHEAMEKKEIQVYMRDDAVQERLRTFGWTGELVGTHAGQDYLMVVNANVQGAKTDANINQSIDHTVSVDAAGKAIATVTIRREHMGTPGDPLYGVDNLSYLRVYVPEGSTLLSAEGFSFPPEQLFQVPEKWYQDDPDLTMLEANEYIDRKTGTRITTEFEKTAFGTWVIVPPGESRTVVFRYELPFTVASVQVDPTPDTQFEKWKHVFFDSAQTAAARYSLVTQKQSGVISQFTSKVTFSDEWQPVWKTSEAVSLNLHGYEVEQEDMEDGVVGVVMEKK